MIYQTLNVNDIPLLVIVVYSTTQTLIFLYKISESDWDNPGWHHNFAIFLLHRCLDLYRNEIIHLGYCFIRCSGTYRSENHIIITVSFDRLEISISMLSLRIILWCCIVYSQGVATGKPWKPDASTSSPVHNMTLYCIQESILHDRYIVLQIFSQSDCRKEIFWLKLYSRYIHSILE